MSDLRTSLAVTYFDPESIPVPEPEPTPEPPKRRGRPPGSKNTPRSADPKRSVPWFAIWRSVFWAATGVISVVSLYLGVQGWLGQSAAHISLAMSVLVAATLLDRDWKKMRK